MKTWSYIPNLAKVTGTPLIMPTQQLLCGPSYLLTFALHSLEVCKADTLQKFCCTENWNTAFSQKVCATPMNFWWSGIFLSRETFNRPRKRCFPNKWQICGITLLLMGECVFITARDQNYLNNAFLHCFSEPNPAAHRVDGVPEIPPWSAETLDYIRLEYPIKVMQDFTKEYTIARDENFGEGFNNILPGC